MSRFFPHTAYAEEQPLYHTILTVHVLTRAVTAGSIVGAGVFGAKDIYQRLRSRPPPVLPRSQLLLRSAGVGSTVAVGLLSIALVGRMWGREEIEWRDRAWRLLENKGQLETDDWTYGGALVGLGSAALAKGGLAALGWKGVVGAAGTGTVAGTVGYMVWRYGVHKGKFSS
ncbi:hypothetical protein UCRPA7_6936 [Phaeoacremonium minimum UCRPA7]|uniref:Uncharacterized protein n=1 Tax=Phaeoacremonium minimum (strain UCR-PA7) TaxID=1286976 RepID=R8BEI0_PHAM7|nr:hypothetical protein UCRPA7_6936 [Phaeoacremonium minimum UCRPA7]EON97690.1 hypothetical protein UCRPA7_6936 [Phaeoacremonium minimum UCRPA7]